MKDLDNIYTYHKPSALQSMKYDMIRAYAKQLADAIETVCPDSRERSLAHTNLEQATMWANASIARYKDPEPVASPFNAPHRVIQKVARDYPPDVFDFVETGEMVEAPEPEPMTPRTNLEWLCDNPEELAKRLDCPYDICPHTDVSGAELCAPCVLGWLREEHKDETH